MQSNNRAWLVCLGCALVLFTTSGLCVNAFTVYQPYILRLNGFSNTQSSSIISLRSLFSFLTMFLTGFYYKRLSYRIGLSLAGAIAALSLVLFGMAGSFRSYCLAAAVMGIGYGLGTMIPITILLTRWFIKRRTLALSICSSVTGLSTLGIPSLLTALIEAYGLRLTFFIEAALVLLMALIAFLLLRDRPEQFALCDAEVSQKPEKTGGPNTVHCLRPWHWLLLIPMLLLTGTMNYTGYSHLTVFSAAMGFSAPVIALGITISGIAMTIGKLAYGAVSEKLSVYQGNRIFGMTALIGILILCGSGGHVPAYFTGMLFYGAGLAFTSVGLASWSAELSSAEQRDRTVRIFQIGYSAGGLISTPLTGFSADICNGSYVPAYLFFALCCVLILCTIQFIYRHS